jgi:hypothetical protein
MSNSHIVNVIRDFKISYDVITSIKKDRNFIKLYSGYNEEFPSKIINIDKLQSITINENLYKDTIYTDFNYYNNTKDSISWKYKVVYADKYEWKEDTVKLINEMINLATNKSNDELQ